ncbi:hypothetical protein [Planomonospora algeriensis]
MFQFPNTHAAALDLVHGHLERYDCDLDAYLEVERSEHALVVSVRPGGQEKAIGRFEVTVRPLPAEPDE